MRAPPVLLGLHSRFPLLIALLAACALLPGADGPDRDPEPPQGGHFEDRAEARHFERLNEHRRSEGLPELERLDCLDRVARAWTSRMARDERLEHNPDLTDDLAASCSPRQWRRAGENIALGSDEAQIFTGWLDSPGHRQNIENEAFRSVGIGVVRAEDGRLWATHVFVRFL